ncbi:MAG: 16S rRNA (uracil(1498)-N(3))-methyltransferase [Clostridia bacterium]|nr:16S rRNA (uracil(1498)-N(3))-methyltransferase [Clostridia bacterium]
MPRFFTDALRFDDDIKQAVIDGEDGRHISRSLRMRIGEALTVSDGSGYDYDGEIEEISGDVVTVRLLTQYKNKSEPTLRVTLYPGIPKGDKLELVVQKATEMGASEITPMLTDRSVSRPDAKSAAKKQDRLQRIALEAAKQSGRGTVPQVGTMTSFKEAVRNAKGTKILFYEGGGLPLSKCLPADETEASIFIGPEGGFAPEEVEFAKENGVITATLGPRILRTETAPLAALSILMYITGNME